MRISHTTALLIKYIAESFDNLLLVLSKEDRPKAIISLFNL